MNRIILFLCIFFTTFSTLQAQKKSELLAKISRLESQLASLNDEVAKLSRSEKASLAKAAAFEKQATELRDANKTLMKNINSFSELSSQNSTNMNKAMESLHNKEEQLKTINDAFSRNDSTAIAVVTHAKKTLGEDTKIEVLDGLVIISASLTSLFTSDTDATLATESENWLKKIAAILITNPNTALTIEGLSMTGDLDLPLQQANAISNSLQKMEITPERIITLGKDGGFKEGIRFKIHPKYDQFYTLIREQMKN